VRHGEDRFRVELQPFDGVRDMPQAHDEAVGEPRRDLQRRRQRRLIDDQ
jgi:hypothetical protein